MQGQNATGIIEQCVFRNCSSGANGGVVMCAFDDQLSVRITTSSFSECGAGAYGGILSIVSDSSMAIVNSVQLVNCTAEDVFAGRHTGEIIYSNQALVECIFGNNILSVCKRGGYAAEYAVWIPVSSTQSLSIFDCVFRGSKDSGVTLKQFFCWSGAVQHIEYINCVFENMKQGSNFDVPVTGLVPSSGTDSMKVSDCVFDSLISMNACSVLDTYRCSDVDILSCVFGRCESGEGSSDLQSVGAILVRGTNNILFSISACIFRNNKGGYSESLTIAIPSGQTLFESIVISNCTFCDHTARYPLARIFKMSGTSESPIGCDVVLEFCSFVNNEISGSYGLFAVRTGSSEVIRYHGCHFNESTVMGFGMINLLSGSGGVAWCFNECLFDQCICPTGGLITSQSSYVGSLSFGECEFVQCNCATGITNGNMNIAKLLCANCTFNQFGNSQSYIIKHASSSTDATFSRCAIIHSSAMISIDVNSVVFEGVEVDGECTCRITIESVERSHFNNCLFDFHSGATMFVSGSEIDIIGSQLSTARQLTNPALSWTGGSLSSELRCLNCCFTGLEPDSSYPYLSLTGTGIANFTDTCFDQAKETCVVISSSVSFVSENDESVMFGNCVCYQPLPPPLSTNTDEEPSPSEFISSESAEEADPSEFTSLESAEESSPSEFIMSESEELSVEQPEKPDDSGTKGNNRHKREQQCRLDCRRCDCRSCSCWRHGHRCFCHHLVPESHQ